MKEILLNIACSRLAALMFFFVRGVELGVAWLIPTYGMVTCASLELVIAAFILGDWARTIPSISPQAKP